jgi:hypothetical protein
MKDLVYCRSEIAAQNLPNWITILISQMPLWA